MTIVLIGAAGGAAGGALVALALWLWTRHTRKMTNTERPVSDETPDETPDETATVDVDPAPDQSVTVKPASSRKDDDDHEETDPV